jgi:hypothetical protein
MIAKYDIFKLRSDGSFVRVEAVEDILAAKQRLDILSAKNPHCGQCTMSSYEPTSERRIAVAVKQFWVHWVQPRGERRALPVRKLRRISILICWISRLRTRRSGVRLSPGAPLPL